MMSLSTQLSFTGKVTVPTKCTVMPRERQNSVCLRLTVGETLSENRAAVLSDPIEPPRGSSRTHSTTAETSKSQVGETIAPTANQANETR